MKKILMITFFSLYFFNTYAQDLRGWHIGVALQPYNYWLRNQDEIDALPNAIIFIQPKLGIPNGFAGGFTFSKYFSDRFGLKGELTYSRQSQRYGQELYAITFSSFKQLDYLKLPVMASFVIAPFQRSSIYCNAGIQLSLLTRYRAEEHYKSDAPSTDYSDDYSLNKSYYGNSSLNNDKNNYEGTHDWLFKRIQIGTIAEIGWLYSINDDWNINFGVRGEYDVLKSENRNAKLYFGSEELYHWNGAQHLAILKENRTLSHNIRLGLNLSLTYKLD